MNEGFLRQKDKRYRNSDAVVSPQTGAVRGNKLIVADDLYPVLHGIIGYPLRRHADHIHMCLQDNARGLFVSGCGILFHDHIADLVPDTAQTVTYCPVAQVFGDLLFMVRGSWNCGNRREFIQNLIQQRAA